MNQHPNNGLRRAFGVIMGKECFLQVMCGKNGNRIKIEMSAHLSRSTAWFEHLTLKKIVFLVLKARIIEGI